MAERNGTSALSVQPRLQQDRDATSWLWTMWEPLAADDSIPAWGAAGRTDALRAFAKAEPILSGALASMVSKAVSLNWQISGGRNRIRRYQEVLAEAEAGAGWSFFLDRWLQDYLNSDTGGWVELGRDDPGGPVVALWNMDAGTLQLTGNVDAPARYVPRLTTGALSGSAVPLAAGDFARIVDMPSPDESKYGMGFCAVSRAYKAAKILLALYNYEDERLSDMPLPGIVSITGMTQSEVKAAFQLYEQMRQSRQQVTFRGLLWLAAQSSPINPIDVRLTPFANLPEGFDREQVLTHYVYTLALDFGVDVREFWPASQTGATKAEAEIQAQKAKGKGFGRMLAQVERAINWNVLPPGLEFGFDQKDSEDDLLRERIRETAIANVRRLWEPAALGAGIISTQEARRWLVENDMAPAWLADTDDATIYGDANTGIEAQADDLLAEKAVRAGLQPGEDLVTMDRAGRMVTVWSSRRVFSLIDTPPVRKQTGIDDPLDSERRKAEKRIARLLYQFFGEQGAEVLAALGTAEAALLAAQAAGGAETAFNVAVNWGEFSGALTATLQPVLLELVSDVAQGAAVPLLNQGLTLSWEVFDRAAADAARRYGYELVTQITDSTRRQLGDIIGRWIESDAGFPDLVERVRKLVPDNPYPYIRDRAQLIAATEVTRVYADGRLTALEAAGLKTFVWQTAKDEIVCPICQPLHGQSGTVRGGVISLADGQAYTPPAHVGCRCWLTASPTELSEVANAVPA